MGLREKDDDDHRSPMLSLYDIKYLILMSVIHVCVCMYSYEPSSFHPIMRFVRPNRKKRQDEIEHEIIGMDG